MHELGNTLDEGKGKDKGRTNARLGQTLALAHALAVQRVAEFVHK